jgi:hypothetical protein
VIKTLPAYLFAALIASTLTTTVTADEKPLPLERLPPARPATPPALPEPPAEALPVEKVICTTQIILREHQSATTLPQLNLREVEAGRGCRTELNIGWLEKKRVCTELELRPRETIEEVTCLTSQPITVTDCNGCPHTEYQQVPVVKKVRVIVFEPFPVERHYLVKVPYAKPIEVNTLIKKLVPEETTVPAIRRTYEALTTHCEIPVQRLIVPLPCALK